MSNVVSLEYRRLQVTLKALLQDAETEEQKEQIQNYARRQGVVL